MVIVKKTRDAQEKWLKDHQDINVPFFAQFWGTAQKHLAYLRFQLRQTFSTSVEFLPSRIRPTASQDCLNSSEMSRRISNVSSYRMPAARLPTGILGARCVGVGKLVGDVKDVFVEELHDALMILWPVILEGSPALHRERPPENPKHEMPVWTSNAPMEAIAGNLCEVSRQTSPRVIEQEYCMQRAQSSSSAFSNTSEGTREPDMAESAWLQRMLNTDEDGERCQQELASGRDGSIFRLAGQVVMEKARTAKALKELELAAAQVAEGLERERARERELKAQSCSYSHLPEPEARQEDFQNARHSEEQEVHVEVSVVMPSHGPHMFALPEMGFVEISPRVSIPARGTAPVLLGQQQALTLPVQLRDIPACGKPTSHCSDTPAKATASNGSLERQVEPSPRALDCRKVHERGRHSKQGASHLLQNALHARSGPDGGSLTPAAGSRSRTPSLTPPRPDDVRPVADVVEESRRRSPGALRGALRPAGQLAPVGVSGAKSSRRAVVTFAATSPTSQCERGHLPPSSWRASASVRV